MKQFIDLELTTLVTGMHLMADLGSSIDVIKSDGFPISAEVPLAPSRQGAGAWAEAMGKAMAGFANAVERIQPDILLLAGDRAETLTGCVAGAYMGVPIAHIQAGDKSGHIDDAARYAIGKLAHIHLASCSDSANRLARLGEQEFRIFNVGAPQLDDIVARDFRRSSITIDGEAIALDTPYMVVAQHPVMVERDLVKEQILATLEACLSTGLRIFWIYPNSDLGFSAILSEIKAFETNNKIRTFTNLERDDFLALLANSSALIGNSSAGILEAPSFKIPVVNIGTRQRGRPQASNIINCGYSKAEIQSALETAMTDSSFKDAAAMAVNPYGDGHSGPRICKILAEIAIDRALLDKESTF
jgi:UDP-N-acetylglucosamine 2-epimerase (non-hydrolysing)/GDP/UDP-N,N'-diacetylbacillosamine 2-epimerase (hydrolysing)